MERAEIEEMNVAETEAVAGGMYGDNFTLDPFGNVRPIHYPPKN